VSVQGTATTLVYQSYRVENVAPWITACSRTVQAWARAQGYEYEFIDDRLFDYVPPWLRERVRHAKLPMSDYARVALANEILQRGYQRCIWVDIDVVIFDPVSFQANNGAREFALTAEVWFDVADCARLPNPLPLALTLEEDKRLLRHMLQAPASTVPDCKPVCFKNVANAVMIQSAGEPFADLYLSTVEAFARNVRGPISPVTLGTRLLTTLQTLRFFPLVQDVGMLSPLVMAALATDDSAVLGEYMRRVGGSLSAVNLCSSFSGQVRRGVEMNEGLYERVLDLLLSTRGDCLNCRAKDPAARSLS
jgi:hypothetical protein